MGRGSHGLDGARPPDRDRPLRVITQRRVQGDGVSEPGLSGDQVATLFEGFASAAIVQVDDLLKTSIRRSPPADGTPTILVSNIRARAMARAGAGRASRPAHIVLWNPFQALDFASAERDHAGGMRMAPSMGCGRGSKAGPAQPGARRCRCVLRRSIARG